MKPREFSQDENDLISPADSKILSFCEIKSNDTLLVKSVKYQLGEFLTGNKSLIYTEKDLAKIKKNEENSLYSVIFYLSPGDYHRYHSPTDFKVKRRNHILGYLWPVKESYIEKNSGVYEDNERVCLFGNWKHGLMTQVYVGATNVGSMTLNHEPEFLTDVILYEDRNEKVELKTYSDEVILNKGGEVGMFRLGSTVVMIFEGPKDLEWTVEQGQKVRYGDVVAKVKSKGEEKIEKEVHQK